MRIGWRARHAESCADGSRRVAASATRTPLPGAFGLQRLRAAGVDRARSTRPFTGRLSVSWPRTADQEPINVGDRRYNPLYRYGYGLQTRQSH